VQPDVVIYNAAAMSETMASGLGPSLFDDLKVTVGGAVTLATFAAKAMKQAGKGTILFTGGGLSLEPHPAWAALGMGKAALRNYAFSLHRELREAGVNDREIKFDEDDAQAAEDALHDHRGEYAQTEPLH